MTRRYYVAENSYGSQTSYGFANTWYVMAFDSKATRDKFVDDSRKLTTQAITRKQVTEFTSPQVKPFSGEFYAIDDTIVGTTVEDAGPYGAAPDGYLGTIVVATSHYARDQFERLNN